MSSRHGSRTRNDPDGHFRFGDAAARGPVRYLCEPHPIFAGYPAGHRAVRRPGAALAGSPDDHLRSDHGSLTKGRDETSLRSTEPSHFLIVLPLDGRSRFTAPGIDVICGAGDIIVANLKKLGKCENQTRQQTIAIALSTAFLEEVTGPVALQGRLPPSPETRLFLAFVRSLVDQLPSTSLASMVPLCRILRDLLAIIVAVQPSADPATGPVALIGRARAYIGAPPPGELNADAIAEALGTTRSTLYRLFKANGGVRSDAPPAPAASCDCRPGRSSPFCGASLRPWLCGCGASGAAVPQNLRLFDERSALGTALSAAVGPGWRKYQT